jgi:GTP-binding protein
MASYDFRNPKFITSAINPEGYPTLVDLKGVALPEIAVAGRSNVGKSSLLNHLFQSKKMVKTSSTPGKTQLINFFTLNDQIGFVDLPGYGFAKVPASIRKTWGPMVQNYLDNREHLKLVLFLFDIRRVPNEDDFLFLKWAVASNKAVILVLTKVDKVKRDEKKANTKKILEAFGATNLHHTFYSTTKNKGRQELITLIHEALSDEIQNG